MENKQIVNNKTTEYFMAPNPLIRKLRTISESSEDCVSYKGVTNKCFFYMVCILLGLGLAVFMQTVPPLVNLQDIAFESEGVRTFTIAVSHLSVVGALGLLVALLLFLITPFLAFLIKPTLPVTGALYCISTGYIYTYISLLVVEYRDAVVIALALTVAVVLSMFVLYRARVIKVTQKMRSVLFTLLLASVLGSIVSLIGYFIPATHELVMSIMGNSVLAIVLSIVGIVIATLFLLVDFATIEESVENKLPKKYEWYCAFGLAFSVIWLFLKILDLVLKVMRSSKK